MEGHKVKVTGWEKLTSTIPYEYPDTGLTALEFSTEENLVEWAGDDYIIYLNNKDKKTNLKPENIVYKQGKEAICYYVLSNNTVFSYGLDSRDHIDVVKDTNKVKSISYTTLIIGGNYYTKTNIKYNPAQPVEIEFETKDPQKLADYLNKHGKEENKVFIPLNDRSIWQIKK